MTSWDVGAGDSDEHFYGEEARRRARRRFLAVVGAVVVMAGFAFALWWAYSASGSNKIASGEVPLLRADGKATKMRPEQPGGYTPPNQDKLVFNPGRAQGQVERLMPAPEAPLPRPVARPEAPPPAAEAVPRVEEGPTTGPVADAAAVPPVPPAPEPAPAPVVAAAPPSPPPAAPAAPPAPKPAVAGAVRLQLGSLKSEDAARGEWGRLKANNGDLLGKVGVAFPKTDLPQKGTYWRIQVGPIGDAAQAERLCSQLKKRNVACILVRS
jgi:cell division septation protein DedD